MYDLPRCSSSQESVRCDKRRKTTVLRDANTVARCWTFAAILPKYRRGFCNFDRLPVSEVISARHWLIFNSPNKLFPEVGPLDPSLNENTPTPDGSGNQGVLTKNGLVRQLDEKAPPFDTFRNFLAVPTIEGKMTLCASDSIVFPC